MPHITIGSSPDFALQRGRVRIQYHCTLKTIATDGANVQMRILRDFSLWTLAAKASEIIEATCIIESLDMHSD